MNTEKVFGWVKSPYGSWCKFTQSNGVILIIYWQQNNKWRWLHDKGKNWKMSDFFESEADAIIDVVNRFKD